MDNIAVAEEQAVSLLEEEQINSFEETNLFKHEKATRAKKIKAVKQTLLGWGFSLWPLYSYAAFTLVPFVLSIYLSMTDLHVWSITQAKWIGFDNYVWMFTAANSKFFWSLGQTLYFSLALPIGIFLGLGSSIMLTSRVKLKKMFRTILYIPGVCSTVGVTMMWQMLFGSSENDLINMLLLSLGVVSQPVSFFDDPVLFVPLLILTTTWGAGSGSILFQSSLEQVNGSLVEAAKVDGASKSQVFFHITIPAISPTIFYVLIMDMIGYLQSMGSIHLFTGGKYGPDTSKKGEGNYAGMTTVYYMYQMGFGEDVGEHGMGRASAVGWILATLIVVVTRINFKLSDYWVCYDA